MLAAYVWHYWIGVVLMVGAVVTVLGVGALYLFSVERKRYPGRRHRVDE
jgi:hypothetical protein